MNNKIRDREKFQTSLLEWYDKEARVLPWRSDPTPFKVWISEMMLQQTRVDTVIPYFTRFISRIPGVQVLAAIEEDELLKLWQGLGYYNRALNLKKAAQAIVEKYEGEIPAKLVELTTLPGIGNYSAGAISSIAFGERVPAIDGNVLRIVARITASKEDFSNPKIKKQFEPLISEVLPLERVGDFNQALMDLGATVCIPNGEPKCRICPVNYHCRAYQEGITGEIPVKVIKKSRKVEEKTVLVISSNGRFALQKRASGGLLPNLWEFPNFEGNLTEEQCRKTLKNLGIHGKEIIPLKPAKHVFTHLEWQLTGYFVDGEEVQHSPELVWATKDEMRHQYSIPTAFRTFIKFCCE